MPSFIIGNASGGEIILSGNPYSGQAYNRPQGGIQIRLDKDASGYCYITFSGGTTLNSGGFWLSGGGSMDGMQLAPGDAYFVPSTAIKPSGTFNVYAYGAAAISGQARLYYEVL